MTANPPTTFIVANAIADAANMLLIRPNSGLEAVASAPIKIIPDIALAPDIRGVCNVGGTLLMSQVTGAVLVATGAVLAQIPAQRSGARPT